MAKAKTVAIVRERERELYSRELSFINNAKKLNINRRRIDLKKAENRVKLYWESLSFL